MSTHKMFIASVTIGNDPFDLWNKSLWSLEQKGSLEMIPLNKSRRLISSKCEKVEIMNDIK